MIKPHWFGPSGPRSKGRGHPLMFSFKETEHFDPFPDGGGYPKGFLRRAFDLLQVENPEEVLHLCSGSVRSGITVDIRPETRPKIVADARQAPFADESFRAILIDPPYNEDYAKNLYGTGKDYPRPGHLLREAARLLKVGGRVGLLHFQVPMIRRPLKIVGVWGITTGSGYAIRAFTVLEKHV